MSEFIYVPGTQNQAVRTLSHGQLSAQAVTPSDSTVFSKPTRGLYVGTSGNVSLIMADGSAITLNALAAGQIHPLSVTQVKATSTTASNIVAFF